MRFAFCGQVNQQGLETIVLILEILHLGLVIEKCISHLRRYVLSSLNRRFKWGRNQTIRLPV